MINLSKVAEDSNLYAVDSLPLVTVYDDNFFVRNDYDVLSFGQRNYLVKYFTARGFKQASGQRLEKNDITLHIPKPNSNLAVSSFEKKFLQLDGKNYYCVTPTMFAEALFNVHKHDAQIETIKAIRRLIKTCPYNVEWLRDISYRSDIEQVTIDTFELLSEFQAFIVKKRFKYKKTL